MNGNLIVFETPDNMTMELMGQIVEESIEWGWQLNHSMKSGFTNNLVQVVLERYAALAQNPLQEGITLSSQSGRNITSITFETALRPQGIVAAALRRTMIIPTHRVLPSNIKTVIQSDGENVTVQNMQRPVIHQGKANTAEPFFPYRTDLNL